MVLASLGKVFPSPGNGYALFSSTTLQIEGYSARLVSCRTACISFQKDRSFRELKNVRKLFLARLVADNGFCRDTGGTPWIVPGTAVGHCGGLIDGTQTMDLKAPPEGCRARQQAIRGGFSAAA
jgi:hypothetical protein